MSASTWCCTQPQSPHTHPHQPEKIKKKKTMVHRWKLLSIFCLVTEIRKFLVNSHVTYKSRQTFCLAFFFLNIFICRNLKHANGLFTWIELYVPSELRHCRRILWPTPPIWVRSFCRGHTKWRRNPPPPTDHLHPAVYSRNPPAKQQNHTSRSTREKKKHNPPKKPPTPPYKQ